MAIRRIRLFPDLDLSVSCAPIQKFDDDLSRLVDDLRETMYASPGVGLAAPQIGVLKQVSVIDVGRAKRRTGTSQGPIVLINPRIIEFHGLQLPREGCLSVPDLLADVRRHATVLVETRTLGGDAMVLRCEGFEALAVQHEIDHLQGRLFLDRVSNLKTDVFRRKA